MEVRGKFLKTRVMQWPEIQEPENSRELHLGKRITILDKQKEKSM